MAPIHDPSFGFIHKEHQCLVLILYSILVVGLFYVFCQRIKCVSALYLLYVQRHCVKLDYDHLLLGLYTVIWASGYVRFLMNLIRQKKKFYSKSHSIDFPVMKGLNLTLENPGRIIFFSFESKRQTKRKRCGSKWVCKYSHLLLNT